MDMAFLCPDAAREFVKVNKEFEIIGAVMQNTSMFVFKDMENPGIVGVPQNRPHLDNIVLENLGKNTQMKKLMGTALPYALENGQVDSVLADFTSGFFLAGQKESAAIKADHTTCVLVVNSDYKKTEGFREFIRFYNHCAKELSNTNVLAKQLEKYKDMELSPSDRHTLGELRVKFMRLDE